MQHDFQQLFKDLTTPHVADACLRTGVPIKVAPSSVRPLRPQQWIVGPVCPTRHTGSVDVFLEALETSAPGDVLVIDNGGRLDEACIGDLVALEAAMAGITGIVVWGLHRDTRDLWEIGIPVFSMGTLPTGPQRLDQRPPDALSTADIGPWTLGRDHFVMADDDGVLFLPKARAEEIAAAAHAIRTIEHRQAAQIREGISFRTQTQFIEYLTRREHDPSLSFRKHLRQVGGAVEE